MNRRAPVRALSAAAAALSLAGLAAGCGGGSSTSQPAIPKIPPARTFHLAGFEPAGPVAAGKPVVVSFTIDQPSGGPLTRYKTGAGPHVGVHLIMVRSDLGAIIHLHPPVGAGGVLRTTVTFPTPGRYRVIVDAYPTTSVSLTNFQLFTWITVAGKHAPQPLPPPGRALAVDGYRFTISAAAGSLKAVEPAFLTVRVTGPDGRPATFTPWFGALAHAIFFRAGSLDYFHTHVCAAGVSGCTSVLGAARVTGVSSAPGVLKVGVLLPLAGTWRLFLQCDVDGKVVTAPFMLVVR